MTPATIEAQQTETPPKNRLLNGATAPSSGDSMLSMIERVLTTPDFDIVKLQHLLELRERYEANEARKAFVEAMSRFKSHSIVVSKDKSNAQYGSKYVSLGNLIGTVTPFLSQHGLSARWDIDQSASIKVTCIITHSAGHSESVSMTCPPDKSGAKNPIQEIKSAITYAKACTFESICGLASSDSNLDNDGNSSGGATGIPADKIQEHCEWMASARNVEELKKLFGNAWTEATKAKDKHAQQAYIKAKNARLAEIQ